MSRAQDVPLPSSQRTLGSTLLSGLKPEARAEATSTWVPAFAGTTVKSLGLATVPASTSSATFGHQEVLP